MRAGGCPRSRRGARRRSTSCPSTTWRTGCTSSPRAGRTGPSTSWRAGTPPRSGGCSSCRRSCSAAPSRWCCRRASTGAGCIRGCGGSTAACGAWRSTSRTSRCGCASTTGALAPARESSATSIASSAMPSELAGVAASPTLSPVIEKLVEQIEGRFAELSAQMSDPEVISDQRRYAEVGRAYRALEPAHQLAQQWRRATDDAAGARELIAEDGDDPELRELLRSSEERLAELEEEIRLAMVEPDPNDDKDVIVEIRPGTGGEEAGLFAADLYRMLSRYADRRGFKQEPISVGDGHYTFAVKGQGAYSVFKYEGGTHRVQRVPETESQGRIHTSTATVAVLPEAEEVDVHIDPSDLQVDVYRSSGPGGQSVNTTDSAVRITHKPTGVVVSMQDEKSQLQNRDRAMRVLRARLLERELAAQQAEEAAQRLAQVGSGARAEKIRTYNFPQDRVTDHRVGVTKGNLPGVLSGELDDFTSALQAEDKRRKLEVSAA